MEYKDYIEDYNDISIQNLNKAYASQTKIASQVGVLSELEIRAKTLEIADKIELNNKILQYYKRNFRVLNLKNIITENHAQIQFFRNSCCPDYYYNFAPCENLIPPPPKPKPCCNKEFICRELQIIRELLCMMNMQKCKCNPNTINEIIIIRFDNLCDFCK